MSENKDYSKWTLEELSTEEKKMKRNEIIAALIIGFLVGVIIFGVAKNGLGFIYIFIPLLLIYGVYRNSQKHKRDLAEIRTEISARTAKQ